MLVELLETFLARFSLLHPASFLVVFLGASALMLWRLEAILDRGWEGTALGTLFTPYASGLGNLVLVGLLLRQPEGGAELAINCLVNNATNLTLLLGLPALLWPLRLMTRKGKKGKPSPDQQITRLSLLLSVLAGIFFVAASWLLGRDGVLGRQDGAMLIGIFAFWQCAQVFESLKNRVRRPVEGGWLLVFDLLVLLGCAAAIYASLDWLVGWLQNRESGALSSTHLGWVTGWLLVLPNALPAFFFAARRKADVVYASQLGDGHICIPLCLGIFAIVHPLNLPPLWLTGLGIIAAASLFHTIALVCGGLARWAGLLLVAAYAGFVWVGF